MERPKVFLLYSEITPYRLALFEELSKEVDLQVNFCVSKSRKRFWAASTDGYSFRSRVLRYVKIGPLIINYLLPFRLVAEHSQLYIIDDDPRLIISKIMTFIIGKLTNKPVIIWSESIGEAYFGKIKNFINANIFSLVNSFIYHNANAFLVSGQKTADFLIRKGLSKKKIHIGTQGLAESELKTQMLANKDEIKSQLQVSGKKIVLFLGYFIKRKGVFELVNAFKRMNRDDSVLIMAGAGKEEGRIKELAAGDKNISFPGYVDGQEKARYYTIADIFVLPTFVDPWGLVIMEAMMFGLPVITTTGAGASELILGNGIVIAPGDEEAINESLEYLLDNDEIREEMGRKSKEIIKEYTVECAAGTFTEAILHCLNDRKLEGSLSHA